MYVSNRQSLSDSIQIQHKSNSDPTNRQHYRDAREFHQRSNGDPIEIQHMMFGVDAGVLHSLAV